MIRRRLRTFTLWTGTLLCVLIVAAFVVSAWWYAEFQVGDVLYVYVGNGGLSVGFLDMTPGGPATPMWRGVYRQTSGLQGCNRWLTDWPWFVVPLYAVFSAVAVPTLLIWRLWPKPAQPGCCSCGYDLRGNVSGTCPECGRVCASATESL